MYNNWGCTRISQVNVNIVTLTFGLLLFSFGIVGSVKEKEDLTLNQPNVDRHAIFSQPLTKGIFHFDQNGFIPLDPMIRIGKVHKEIIKTIQGIKDYQKQVKYLLTLSNTANDDIVKLKEKITDVLPSDVDDDDETKVAEFDRGKLKADAFVLLVSHAGMMGNLVLYFPDIMGILMKKNPYFETNLKWTIKFTVDNKLTQDKTHLQLFNLAQQELGIKEKDPDYKNPYKSQGFDDLSTAKTTTTKKPRKKLPRGPQLTGGRAEL